MRNTYVQLFQESIFSTNNRWISTFMILANTATNDCLSQIINIHQRVWWIILSYHRYYQLQNYTSLPVYGNRINYGRHTHLSVHYIYCFNPWRPHRSRNGLLIFYSDEFWACGVLTCVWMIEDLDRPKITIQAIFACQRWPQNFMLRALKHNVVFVNSPIISTHDDLEFSSQPG